MQELRAWGVHAAAALTLMPAAVLRTRAGCVPRRRVYSSWLPLGTRWGPVLLLLMRHRLALSAVAARRPTPLLVPRRQHAHTGRRRASEGAAVPAKV
jgi:hypothetical protein